MSQRKTPRTEGRNDEVWSKALRYGGYTDNAEILQSTLNLVATTLAPQNNDLAIDSRAVVLPSQDSPNTTIKPVIAYMSDPQLANALPQLSTWLPEMGCAQVRNHIYIAQGTSLPSDEATNTSGLAYVKLSLDVGTYVVAANDTSAQFETNPPLDSYTVGRELFAVARTYVDGPPPTSTLQPGTCSTATAEYSGTMYNLSVSSLIASDPTRKGIMGAPIQGGITNILGDRIKLVLGPVTPSLTSADNYARESGNILENTVLTGAASTPSQPYGAPGGTRSAAIIGPCINVSAADVKPPDFPVLITGNTGAAAPVVAPITAKVVPPLLLNTRTTGGKVFVPVIPDIPTLILRAKVSVAIQGSQEPSGPWAGLRASGEVHVIVYCMQATSSGQVILCAEPRRYIVESLGVGQSYAGLSSAQTQSAFGVNPASWYPTSYALPSGMIQGLANQLLYQSCSVTGGVPLSATPAVAATTTSLLNTWALNYYQLPTVIEVKAQFPSKYWTYLCHYVQCTNNGGFLLGTGILGHPFSYPFGLQVQTTSIGLPTVANTNQLDGIALQGGGSLYVAGVGLTQTPPCVNTCLTGTVALPDWSSTTTVIFGPSATPSNYRQALDPGAPIAQAYCANLQTGYTLYAPAAGAVATVMFAESVDAKGPQLVFTEIDEIIYRDGRYYQPGYNTATFVQVEGMPAGCSLVKKSTHWCQMVPDAKLVRDGNVNMQEFATPDGVKTDTINLLHSLYRSNMTSLWAYGYTEPNYIAAVRTVAEALYASSPAMVEEKLAIFASASGAFTDNRKNMQQVFGAAGLADAFKALYFLYENNPTFRNAVQESAAYLANKVKQRVQGFLERHGSANTTGSAAVEFRPAPTGGNPRSRIEEANRDLRSGLFPLQGLQLAMSNDLADDDVYQQPRPGGGNRFVGVREPYQFPYASGSYNMKKANASGHFSASGMFGASSDMLPTYNDYALACGKCNQCSDCPYAAVAPPYLGGPMQRGDNDVPRQLGVAAPLPLLTVANIGLPSGWNVLNPNDYRETFSVEHPAGFWEKNKWINKVASSFLPGFGIGIDIAEAVDPKSLTPLGLGYQKGTITVGGIDAPGYAEANRRYQKYMNTLLQDRLDALNSYRKVLDESHDEEQLPFQIGVTALKWGKRAAQYGPEMPALTNQAVNPTIRLAQAEKLFGIPRRLAQRGANILERFFGRTPAVSTVNPNAEVDDIDQFGGEDPAEVVETYAPEEYEDSVAPDDFDGGETDDIAENPLITRVAANIGDAAEPALMDLTEFAAAGQFQQSGDSTFWNAGEQSFSVKRSANGVKFYDISPEGKPGIQSDLLLSTAATLVRNINSGLTNCSPKNIPVKLAVKDDRIFFPKKTIFTTSKFFAIASELIPASSSDRCILNETKTWFSKAAAYMKSSKSARTNKSQGDEFISICEVGKVLGVNPMLQLKTLCDAVNSIIKEKTVYNWWTGKEENMPLDLGIFTALYAGESFAQAGVIGTIIPIIFAPYGYHREINRNYVAYPGSTLSVERIVASNPLLTLSSCFYIWKGIEKYASLRKRSTESILIDSLMENQLITPQIAKKMNIQCGEFVQRLIRTIRYVCNAILVSKEKLKQVEVGSKCAKLNLLEKWENHEGTIEEAARSYGELLA